MSLSTPLTTPVRDRGVLSLLTACRNGLDSIPTSLLMLALRVAVAVVFFRSGLTKIANWDTTVALFDMEYMLPLLPAEVGAYLAATAELTFPVLLVVGLATRLAAASLLGMTLVIQLFVYPENWPDHLLWGSILALLMARGAGALSLDRLIDRRFLRRPATRLHA